MRSDVSQESKMADTSVLCSFAFFIIWFSYGLKWAILILFTILLVKLTASVYSNGDILTKRSSHFYQNHGPNTADKNTNLGATERSIRRISRRYVKPIVEERDLAFTDLQMNRSLPHRRRNSLESPEPLISQITRHLSFSHDTSYYPNRTRMKSSINQHNTTFNTTRLNNSYIFAPMNQTNISLSNTSPEHNPYLNMAASPLQQRYMAASTLQERYMAASPLQECYMAASPLQERYTAASSLQQRYTSRSFSVLDPAINIGGSPSVVKISQPSAGGDESPLSFESILQKRSQRTREDPCSRYSVLSALGQKTRKRSALESDDSFLETTYSVKKRRRDELDDFLDSVADPLSMPKYSSSIVKSLKRPFLHSVNEKDFYTLSRADKRLRERQTSSENESVASTDKIRPRGNESTALDVLDISNKISVSTGDGDSGVMLSISDDLSTKPVKSKKRKSVTFSQETEEEPDICEKEINNNASSEVLKNTMEKHNQVVDGQDVLGREKTEIFPVFQTHFSPRKPIHSTDSSPLTKDKEQIKRRRSHLAWKDLQENRREAWRRSQKLLDDIEESLAKEKGVPSGSVITSSNVGLQHINGISKTVVSSTTDNVTKTVAQTSHGLLPSQGLSLTSLPTTTLLSSTNTSSTLTSKTDSFRKTAQPAIQAGAFTNLVGTVPKSELARNQALSSRAVSTSHSLGTNAAATLSSSHTLTSNSIFRNPSGINPGVKTVTSTSVTALNFSTGTNGNISGKGGQGGTNGFKFAVPKSPVKTTLATGVSHDLTASTASSDQLSVAPVVASAAAVTPFSVFGTNITSSAAGQQPTTNSTTFQLRTTSNIAPSTQSSTDQPKFGFLAQTGGISSTKANPSLFSYQAPAVSSSSTTGSLPQTALSTFSFQAPPDPAFGKNPQPASHSTSSQSKAADLFNFNTATSTASVFGQAGVQTSTPSGFGFVSSNVPTYGNQGLSTAGTAPAVNKPNTSSGFNFATTTPGPFAFGSPASAAGGFNFSAAVSGPGTPFASSTPMPGNAGGMPGGAFTLGSSGRGGAAAAGQSRTRQRRRQRK